MTVAEIIRKIMLAGIGAQEKVMEFIDELVKAGEISKSEGAELVKECMAKAQTGTKDIDAKLKDVVTTTLEKFNIPTREDLRALEKKIDSLSARISKLEGNGGPGAI